eukprot:CAMPEP_0170549968 /NCGR_PEP_ID=MMETSP0211-20121228/8041_1 /TAXON_ID=311385 /ORGANISM="Pseudokeronopsis sp., Strain OXSARD2" /LENGTH=178 /DNA_ID=CAMNT_0010856227 /DNA_START=558 /DNA_END=1094 /DNA_ORIENTATION=+
MTGVNTYNSLIKSLIARIENDDMLAPLQEIGRHQSKLNLKKKKKKAKEQTEQPEGAPHQIKYDDNFYDLDDDFIDDGDLHHNDDIKNFSQYEESSTYSRYMQRREEGGSPKEEAEGASDNESQILKHEIMQSKLEKVLERYRVLLPADTNKMLVDLKLVAPENLNPIEELKEPDIANN